MFYVIFLLWCLFIFFKIVVSFFFFFFGNFGIWAVIFSTIHRRGFRPPTEGILNPLWPKLEPGWRAVQLYLFYHQATSAWLKLLFLCRLSILNWSVLIYELLYGKCCPSSTKIQLITHPQAYDIYIYFEFNFFYRLV